MTIKLPLHAELSDKSKTASKTKTQQEFLSKLVDTDSDLSEPEDEDFGALYPIGLWKDKEEVFHENLRQEVDEANENMRQEKEEEEEANLERRVHCDCFVRGKQANGFCLAVQKESLTKKNPHRQYWACRKRAIDSSHLAGCKYFAWCDEC
jgi:hypothetical protein